MRRSPKGFIPLTTAWVNSKIASVAAAASLGPGNYSSHSFRAGRTTDLVEQNCDDASLRESGRWRSQAYLQYVRFDVFDLPKKSNLVKNNMCRECVLLSFGWMGLGVFQTPQWGSDVKATNPRK